MLLSSYYELGGESWGGVAGEKKTEQNIKQPSPWWQISTERLDKSLGMELLSLCGSF